MTLRIFTSRIWTRDPNRLDITRGNGGEAGAPFAPSKAILVPALEARTRAKFAPPKDAARIEAEMWAAYAPAYREEMRRSYREHRGAWDALLDCPRVVLTCYCAIDTWLAPTELLARGHCHRVLLAGYLAACGAVYGGEIGAGDGRRSA